MSLALGVVVIGGIAVTWTAVNKFIASFGGTPVEERTTTPRHGGPPPKRTVDLEAALRGGSWDDLHALYDGKADPPATPEVKARIGREMLATAEGRQALATRPKLAGAVLSATDPAALEGLDLRTTFGEAGLAEALLATAWKRKPASGMAPDRSAECDPALLARLAREADPALWNDTGAAIGAPKRGLGPRVVLGLWRSGSYDQICELIRAGVDTSLAARVEPDAGKGGGIYSGFVQPIEHIVQKSLRDIDALDKGTSTLTGFPKIQAEGAKKILAALEETGHAGTVTRWSEVEGSEMIAEFKAHPGTIWGFEDVRLPFVQAAHATDEGVQPLRMMELWEAVQDSLSAENYQKLLDDPVGAADLFVAAGEKKIRAGIGKNAKYADIARDAEAFIASFKRDARAFLLEFAAQMPKGSFARTAIDADGRPKPGVAVSEFAGILPDKFMGGLACKAGLWWAKQEGKPVYYCLDGVNMDDVTNYKKVKNKAIEEFIASDGQPSGAKGHDEVITLVELREILKNWDELQATVKFVLKGRLLTAEEAELKVKQWQAAMELANREAGRAPAPDRSVFARELDAIDPGLAARLQVGAEGDKDARDIVRKAGYLLRVAKARPEIVLKYLISKCGVLVTCGLVPAQVPVAARDFKNAPSEDKARLGAVLIEALKGCSPRFRAPLADALVRHPQIAGMS